MANESDARLTGYSVEELNRLREEWERKREERRNSWASVVSCLIVALSFLFSLDFRSSPPGFQPMVIFFGIILAVMIYLAAIKGPEVMRRAEAASRRSQSILDSISANLVKLSQLEERLTQIEIRIRRLEEVKGPPPRSM